MSVATYERLIKAANETVADKLRSLKEKPTVYKPMAQTGGDAKARITAKR